MRQRLRMREAIGQRMELRCSTCKQAIGGPIRDSATNTDSNLFGAVQYVVCPTCNQVVPEQLWTPAYKSIWTRKAREKVRAPATRGTGLPVQGAVATNTIGKPHKSQVSVQHETATARVVAEWMYAEVTQRVVLWYAYAVSAICTTFGREFIDDTKEENPTISQKVLDEFRLLCGDSVIWDEGLSQWRTRA